MTHDTINNLKTMKCLHVCLKRVKTSPCPKKSKYKILFLKNFNILANLFILILIGTPLKHLKFVKKLITNLKNIFLLRSSTHLLHTVASTF